MLRIPLKRMFPDWLIHSSLFEEAKYDHKYLLEKRIATFTFVLGYAAQLNPTFTIHKIQKPKLWGLL